MNITRRSVPRLASSVLAVSLNLASVLPVLAQESGNIVIDKVTAPAGDSTSFTFTRVAVPQLGTHPAKGLPTFSLTDGDPPNDSGPISPGVYDVTEMVPAGWSLTDISCTDPSGGTSTNTFTGTARIDLAAGETVTCTFTNTQLGTIVIGKETDPAGGTGFGFTIFGEVGFTLDDGQTESFLELFPGTYSVTEDDPSGLGFLLADVTCVDSDAGGTASSGDVPSRTATIELDPGETVTCTFTNAAIVQGSIEITKTAQNPQVFAGETASFTIAIRNTGLTDLTNLAAVDPLTPDCARDVGELPPLAPGETTSYTCETAPLFADLTNQATVTADVPAGPPISASASATVDILEPIVEITKTPAEQQVLAGETATFTITVRNLSDTSDLIDLVVTDPLTPDCERGGVEGADLLPNLRPGQSVFYECTTDPLGADLVNVATVTAVTREGLPVEASASARVDVIAPIVITKSPSEQQILPGGTATFTITLENPGSVPKTNVVVSDPLTPACDRSLASLAAGASFSYTCTTDPLSANLTNRATVTADSPAGQVEASSTALVRVVEPPIEITKELVAQVVNAGDTAPFTITVSNPGTATLTDVSVADTASPDCARGLPDIPPAGMESYGCASAPVFADFTNVATVTATAGGVPVSASASAEVNVRQPIVIVKAPAEQSLSFGETATFTITLINEGTDTKTDVAVSDPLAPDCERTAGELGDLAANGGAITYTCTTAALTADLLNVATVTATGDAGQVTASDSALVVVLDDLTITKTPALQELEAGTPATFTIEVTNTGDQTVIGVAVADPATTDCERDLGDLGPGAVVSYSCATEPLFADLTNVATVSGEVTEGLVAAVATAVVEVFQPIAITKEPPEQEIQAGETAEFTITVSNPSRVARIGVAVSDPLTPSCDRLIGDLAPGDSTSYVCATGVLFADLTNVATATGGGPSGTVSAFDGALVRVAQPVIAITKTPAAQLVAPGGTASFTITLTNPGPDALTSLTVSDPLTPDCARGPGVLPDLPADTSTSYDCATGPLSADFSNVATVSATSDTGVAIEASASAVVNVIQPIEIVKAPLDQQVPAGTRATFTITITNDEAVAKTQVMVSDPLSPDCARAVPDLTPTNRSFSYDCESEEVNAEFTNVATVTADSPSGQVTASASAFVGLAEVQSCFTGPTATGSGVATICVSGGGPSCGFIEVDFVALEGEPQSPPAGSAPGGFAFPHGLVSLLVTGCTPGSTLTFTWMLPAVLPDSAVYWKFGPTADDPTPHWYALPATVAGDTVTFSVTDGGLGDGDLLADGTIVDPSGPGISNVQIPTLGEGAMLLLAGLLVLTALAVLRRRV